MAGVPSMITNHACERYLERFIGMKTISEDDIVRARVLLEKIYVELVKEFGKMKNGLVKMSDYNMDMQIKNGVVVTVKYSEKQKADPEFCQKIHVMKKSHDKNMKRGVYLRGEKTKYKSNRFHE